MNSEDQAISQFIDNEFYSNFVPAISEFISIDNQSKDFDANWNTNGLLEKAANFVKSWIQN